REEDRAKQWPREERIAAQRRGGARRAQEERPDHDETDEQPAIDRAFDKAGAPMVTDGVEPRRPAPQPVERNPRHQVHDRPQAALSKRGAGAGKKDPQNWL